MLNESELDNESKHEKSLRDIYARTRYNTSSESFWWENRHNYMEIIPTLEALSMDQNMSILELGCGDGRYTTFLANCSKWVLAVDFSIHSLRSLQRNLFNPKSLW